MSAVQPEPSGQKQVAEKKIQEVCATDKRQTEVIECLKNACAVRDI